MGGRKLSSPQFWWRNTIKSRIILLTFLVAYCCQKPETVNANSFIDTRMHVKGLKIRAPRTLEKLVKELEGEAESSGGLTQSQEIVEVGPFFGNAEVMKTSETRKKKTCGMSAVAARAIINPSLKRSYFATTPEEVAMKQDEEIREKREIKRNDFLGDGPLPWTCETKYEWKDMGPDHYPRFVRTAECKTRLCFNGFFRCKPRRYKTKVLRRVTGPEAASCEDDDVSLPESLRNSWKFITVTINLCCDCAGRLPMPEAS